jgi:hypothetical protein
LSRGKDHVSTLEADLAAQSQHEEAANAASSPSLSPKPKRGRPRKGVRYYIKTVKGHEYEYKVELVVVNGEPKQKWTYLGPVKARTPAAPPELPVLEDAEMAFWLYDLKMLEASARRDAETTKIDVRAKAQREAIRAGYPVNCGETLEAEMQARLGAVSAAASKGRRAAEAQYRQDNAPARAALQKSIDSREVKIVGNGRQKSPSQLAEELLRIKLVTPLVEGEDK